MPSRRPCSRPAPHTPTKPPPHPKHRLCAEHIGSIDAYCRRRLCDGAAVVCGRLCAAHIGSIDRAYVGTAGGDGAGRAAALRCPAACVRRRRLEGDPDFATAVVRDVHFATAVVRDVYFTAALQAPFVSADWERANKYGSLNSRRPAIRIRRTCVLAMARTPPPLSLSVCLSVCPSLSLSLSLALALALALFRLSSFFPHLRLGHDVHPGVQQQLRPREKNHS